MVTGIFSNLSDDHGHLWTPQLLKQRRNTWRQRYVCMCVCVCHYLKFSCWSEYFVFIVLGILFYFCCLLHRFVSQSCSNVLGLWLHFAERTSFCREINFGLRTSNEYIIITLGTYIKCNDTEALRSLSISLYSFACYYTVHSSASPEPFYKHLSEICIMYYCTWKASVVQHILIKVDWLFSIVKICYNNCLEGKKKIKPSNLIKKAFALHNVVNQDSTDATLECRDLQVINAEAQPTVNFGFIVIYINWTFS